MATKPAGSPAEKETRRVGPRLVSVDGRAPAKEDPDLTDPRHYINRELSLLRFQERVFEEAQDPSNPLLERAKFLSIVGSNLDEFFMVRVAGLQQQLQAGVVDASADGMTPAEQLAAIRKEAGTLMGRCQALLKDDLLPALQASGIRLLNLDELSDRQRQFVQEYFENYVFPVLTPMAYDPGRPFPHISNLSLNLAVLIRDEAGEERFARVKVPRSLPRLVPLKRSSGGVRKDGTVPRKHLFVWLEQLIVANLPALFPGMKIVEAQPFRLVRDADTAIQELEAADLLETIEQSVRQRHFGRVVMVALNPGMPRGMKELLIKNLEIDARDVFELEGPLGLSSLMQLASIERYDLRYKPFLPPLPKRLTGGEEEAEDIFAAIRRQDILLHHPFDPFHPVVDFLQQAARDPEVLAIKQTLYRVGRNSPVVGALLEARRNGKEVAVLVELKARFDEESNIEWARALEREGVHVVYGLLGLKTHSKIALVVRREGEGIRRYVHLSTGNYNAVTAQLYTDLGMFTCDAKIGADATDLFNYLTGYSTKTEYRKLLVAPIHLRKKLRQLIKREIEHQVRGGKGRLIFAMNSLVDSRMIRQLYEASRAGVKIDLLVRGMCSLRPGVKGLSEQIRVTSIVGRFLEHSRIYYFQNGGQEEVYLGSADLMPRNLDHRVEVLFPVQDKQSVRYLRQQVLAMQLADNVKARRMRSDGEYSRIRRSANAPAIDSQHTLMVRPEV